MRSATSSAQICTHDLILLPHWSRDASAARCDPFVDGFLPLGVGHLADARDDVAERTREPGRIVVNVHVADARAAADRLEEVGAPWRRRRFPGCPPRTWTGRAGSTPRSS